MITRIRLEAISHADKDATTAVRQQLIDEIARMREIYGGEWDIESEQTQTSRDGAWGSVTIRRIGNGVE